MIFKNNILNSKLLEQFKKLVNRENVKLNQKLLIFGFFVVVSTFFWFLNALNKEYSSEILYPVNFSNFPERKILISELPSHLTFKVNAHGYLILKNKLGTAFNPINFDVSSFPLNSANGGDTELKYILTRQTQDRLSRQLSSDINILSISPDTLFFKFSDLVNKKVPVSGSYDLIFDRQYMLYGSVSFNPDSVIITGPESMLDTIQFVKTEYTKFNGLNQTEPKELKLQNINNVSFSSRNVVIIIPVEQYTETNLDIAIEVNNLPDTLNIKIFPKSLKVSYLVSLKDYEKVKPQLFKLSIDYNDVLINVDKKLKVTLEEKPEYLKSVKISKNTVEYIIEKK